jgi:aldose 1-epimerase
MQSARFTCLTVLTALLGLVAAPPVAAQRYTARQDGDVVRIEDRERHTSVSILPSVGNIAFDMTVNGQKVLRWPYASVEEFKTRPGLSGIPFLGPWANRLDEQAFYANGRKYTFDMELGNIRGAIPIHGFLTSNDQWHVVTVNADDTSAWVTSKLEFYRNPLWMKQFPFAHTLDMTYRLHDGVLQVTLRIENLSNEPMPVAIGFHPYFMLTDSKREGWTLSVAAKTHWLLAQNKVPTGETQAIEKVLPDPRAVALKDYDLDHVFGDLIRDAEGRAVMTVKGARQQLDVVLGPHYRAAVIYAPNPATPVTPRPGQPAMGVQPPGPPPDRNFICIEPMAGITDAMNLSQKGLYHELQSIAPGGVWEESFWVRPSGF